MIYIYDIDQGISPEVYLNFAFMRENKEKIIKNQQLKRKAKTGKRKWARQKLRKNTRTVFIKKLKKDKYTRKPGITKKNQQKHRHCD